MQEVGYGIIGCGVIAPFHLAGIAKATGAKLVAVCDIIPEKAEKFARDNNIPAWYTDYKELLKRPDIDIVSICTPSGLHGEIAITAAKAGKHILCEKPMDITLEVADRMINAAIQANVKLGICFQRRTYDSSLQIRQAITSGVLGKLVLINAELKYYRSQGYYNSAGWRGTWELDGGGCLMNQGIHGIDLLQYFVGPIASVYAKADHLVRKIQVEDTAVILLTYTNGAYGVIRAATSVYPGQDTEIDIHGDKGTIIQVEMGIDRFVVQGPDGQSKDLIPVTERENSSSIAISSMGMSPFGHERIVQNMIDAVLENKPLYCSGIEGRKALEIILAIYQSARKKKEISLPL
ncbi:MAG: Gfo/Idh/MocA family protein [bacterium]